MQDHDVIGRLRLLHLLRHRRLRERTADSILYDGQLPVLEYVTKRPGSTQIQIASWLAVTPASIAQSTKRLQRAGLIEKRVDESNLRCNRLYATEHGIAVAKSYRVEFDRLDEQMLEGLTETDKQMLIALLDRLIRNINTDGAECPHLHRGE